MSTKLKFNVKNVILGCHNFSDILARHETSIFTGFSRFGAPRVIPRSISDCEYLNQDYVRKNEALNHVGAVLPQKLNNLFIKRLPEEPPLSTKWLYEVPTSPISTPGLPWETPYSFYYEKKTPKCPPPEPKKRSDCEPKCPPPSPCPPKPPICPKKPQCFPAKSPKKSDPCAKIPKKSDPCAKSPKKSDPCARNPKKSDPCAKSTPCTKKNPLIFFRFYSVIPYRVRRKSRLQCKSKPAYPKKTDCMPVPKRKPQICSQKKCNPKSCVPIKRGQPRNDPCGGRKKK